MQPYFLPYLGYWHLLNATDTFVIYDDVNYIKGGYINRNYILSPDGVQRLTLEVLGAGSNKKINQVMVGGNASKLLKQIEHNYSKRPLFDDVMPLIESILTNEESYLSRFLENTIRKIVNYLELDVEIIVSSALDKYVSLSGEDKVLNICESLGAEFYINLPGGFALYKKDSFERRKIELKFIESTFQEYLQGGDGFVPRLSILDLIMNVGKKDLRNHLNSFELISGV